MSETKVQLLQLQDSTTPGAILTTNGSNNVIFTTVTTGADKIWFYDDSAAQTVMLTLGTNLSITGTTLNASAGAGGYAEIQDEGSALTARTKFNFIGGGITATDDAGNTRTNITLDATLNALAAFNTNGLLVQTAADTFAGRTLVAPAAGFTVTNADGVAGNPTFVLANDLNALEALASTGIAVRTAADTWAQRTMTGTTNRLTVTDGAGTSGNPTFDISTAYVGQATITTLGTVTTGTWNATAVGPTFGGTGLTSYTLGDTLYASAPNVLSKLGIGSTGHFYRVVAGIPGWTTAASTDLSNSSNIALLNATQTFTGTNTFSNNITMNGTPSALTDLITVGYLANFVGGGLKYHSVQAATTATQAVSARTSTTLTVGGTTYTVDGRTMTNGDFVLIKNDTSGAGGAGAADNGPYLISGIGSSVLLTRALYMDAANEVDAQTFIVEDGSTNVGTVWITISEVTTLGTDSIIFSQIQTSGTVTGTGVNNQISVWSGTNSQDGNSTFTWDQTQMTVGTATPVVSSRVTTQGTGTTSATFGLTHNNSSAAKVFSIADDGSLHVGVSGSRLSINSTTLSNSTQNLLLSGTATVTFQSGGTSHTGSQVIGDTGFRQITSGTTDNLQLLGTFSPTSGTATNAQLWINNTINQSGGANGITRGIWVVPTLTAAADYRGLEITANASHYALYTTAGKIRFDLGSDANWDLPVRSTTGNLTRIANGTTGQFLGANTGAAPTWQTPAGGTITRAYLTGSTSSVIDLDSGTAVTDVDGAAIAFTVPADLDKTFVVRNGITLSRSGTVTRDYTLVSATGVLTLARALSTGENLMVYKIV